MPPVRSPLEDCLSKITQADDSKSSVAFDHANNDDHQEDVGSAPEYSSVIPNGEGQSDNRDSSQPFYLPAPQALDTAVNLPDGQRPEPRRSSRAPVPRKLYDATTGKYV